mmetsp:Transcript_8009/g.17085  ORF Transcript_8009/g.17085 Transcript_8009/m.17085 type:complete len:129 (+) Transcript_8009:1632-2018(+)
MLTCCFKKNLDDLYLSWGPVTGAKSGDKRRDSRVRGVDHDGSNFPSVTWGRDFWSLTMPLEGSPDLATQRLPGALALQVINMTVQLWLQLEQVRSHGTELKLFSFLKAQYFVRAERGRKQVGLPLKLI